MKFGQTIEYNMKKIFLQKSYTKCGGETILGPFYEKSKLRTSLHKCYKSLFLLYVQVDV